MGDPGAAMRSITTPSEPATDVVSALAATRERTLALTGADPAAVPAAASGEGERGPSWPWFLGWLAAAALSWWLERRRRAPVNDSRMQNA